MKLGDGIMNRTWNPRYFLLRGSSLQYFASSRDIKPREIVDLLNAEVSWLGDYLDRSNCIVIEPAAHRTLHVSGASLDEARQWLRWFQEAADPQAYAGLIPPTMNNASPDVNQSDLVEKLDETHPPLGLPPDLPHQFTEAGEALINFVTGKSGGLNLIDVCEGVRIFSSQKDREEKSGNNFLLYGLAGLVLGTVLNAIFPVLCIVLSLYIISRKLKSVGKRITGGITRIERVTSRGCRNWILDACKYPLWMPGVVEAFSNKLAEWDEVHYIFNGNSRGHICMLRFCWEAKDGSFVILSVGKDSPNRFEAWCVGRDGVLWFIDSYRGESQEIQGLRRITAELGDHDGSGIGVLKEGWLRHWKGGISNGTRNELDYCFEKKWMWSVLLGESKFATLSPPRLLNNRDPPLQSLAGLFARFQSANCTEVVKALLGAFPESAINFAQTAWTKSHVKTGDSLLSHIGEAQIYLAVTEATSRPSQGLSATVTVKITSGSWNLSGRIKYSISIDCRENFWVRISFSGSEFTLEDSPAASSSVHVACLPDFLFGADENRAVVDGVLRVDDMSSSRRYVLRFTDKKGCIRGCILSQKTGHAIGTLEGNWLENLSLNNNELMWTYSPGFSSLKKSSEEGSGATLLARMSSADEDALSFVNLLRKSNIPGLDQERFNDGYLYRFSKARNFDLSLTSTMLKTHLAWASEHQIEQAMNFSFSELSQVQAAFPHGYHGVDKFGRPIYISRLAKTDQEALFQATNWERFIKYWIQSYESLIWKKIPACEKKGGKNPPSSSNGSCSLAPLQTLTILDIKGIGLSQLNSKVREFISVTSKIASDNYPEILGAMYIVNSPTVFPIIWNAIKGMIDPGTRAKTHVINAKHTREKLLEVINPDQLPFFLGGDCKCGASPHLNDDSDFGCLSSDMGPWNT